MSLGVQQCRARRMEIQIKGWCLFMVEKLLENLFRLLTEDSESICTLPGKMGVCENQK